MKKEIRLRLFLILLLILNSCGANEEVSNELKSKSTTYTERVDLDELVNKLRSREPELAIFIESNPVSNLKANSGKTDYYFDNKNIVAIKNDKNEAAYSIPLYIKSETRSNILNALSVEITDTHIDVKLITMESLDDDTVRYYASSFDSYKAKSLTAKTKRFDCYCVSIARDCKCHDTHAAGGCDHPDVLVSCGCSGDGFTAPDPTPATPVTKTSWSGGSGGGTTYASTGSGIYFALQKMFKPDYEFNLLEKYTIVNNYPYSKLLIEYLDKDGDTPVNKAFVVQMIYNLEDGQFTSTAQLSNTIQNFRYSQKSPLNVDLMEILNNPAAAENKKFIATYDALTTSPEFQKLFIDIFGSSTRYNVKFEIAEHVYENNDPTKEEVNATTSQDPVTKNIIIKISQQILVAGTSKSQTNIENAKTILHECIHAYLFTKANNPAVGVDFVKILNTMYPTPNEQHDFMYSFMIPTMQKVLGEIRDLVVLKTNKDYFEDFTLHPTTIPLTSVTWNWNDYYKYLSLNGLEEATCFKADFPENSYEHKLFTTYIFNGHRYLNY